MNRKQIAITLGIMCIVLTFAIAVQIRTTSANNKTALQTLSDNGLRDSVLKWKEKYDNISEDLKKAEKELEQARAKATEHNASALAKEEELKKNNNMLGLTDVTGNGLIIEFRDGKADKSIFGIGNESQVLVHYTDLLIIVNELKNSGAEAIEINGQRIINTSAITCEGTVIKINGEKIGSPFVIKAIGSQGLLYGQMVRAGSYIDLMKEEGIELTRVEQVENIEINKYSGTINFKYLTQK